MKNKLTAAIALASIAPLSAYAEPTIYGKANVSLESVSNGDDSYTRIQSNASRLGVKGSEKINDDLEAVYQLEYEVFVDDGDKDSDTFTQRNIFAGLKGGFGTVLVGKMDSPLKTAQKKIDLFGDLPGDIKNVVTTNENRPSNVLAYQSPSMSGVSAKIAYVPSESDDGDDASSVSLAFENEAVYLAVAMDSGIEGVDIDATRVVGQFKLGAFQLGALFETMSDADDNDTDAAFVSVKYNVSKEWAIKAQYGQSDQYEEGGDIVSVGADYKLSKNAKVFGFHTSAGADDDAIDSSATGLGLEVKF